jgi:hypothetical protein
MAILRLFVATALCLLGAACERESQEPRVLGSPSPVTSGISFEYQCHPGFPFDPDAIGSGNVEEASGEKAEAVQRVFGYSDAGPLPVTGWTEVYSDQSAAGYVARRDDRFFEIRLEREEAEWTPAEWGPCRAEAFVEEGAVAYWALEPGTEPQPDDRQIEALVTEWECRSGRDVRPHLLSPEIVYEEDAIYVLLGAEIEARGFECPGNPIVEHTIELDQAIGDRALFDAASYPPQPADRKLRFPGLP